MKQAPFSNLHCFKNYFETISDLTSSCKKTPRISPLLYPASLSDTSSHNQSTIIKTIKLR